MTSVTPMTYRTMMACFVVLALGTCDQDAASEPTGDPSGDPDGDGLTTEVELAGYTIQVNGTGVWTSWSRAS